MRMCGLDGVQGFMDAGLLIANILAEIHKHSMIPSLVLIV